MRILGTLLVLSLTFSFCTNPENKDEPEKNAKILERYSSESAIDLPDELQEISGLTNSNGKIYAHNDEEGIIYELDYVNRKITAAYNLKEKEFNEDFEGIAAVDNNIYMITSSGELYKYEMGADGKSDKIQTGLKSKNDVEGLCYYPPANALLLALKGDPGNDLKDKKAVYAFDLENNELKKEPFLVIDENELKNKFDANFAPSGIAYNAADNTLFIISANDRGIIEVTPEGEVLKYSRLSSKSHKQPEAITIIDNKLLIGDEGGSKGKLTVYNLE